VSVGKIGSRKTPPFEKVDEPPGPPEPDVIVIETPEPETKEL